MASEWSLWILSGPDTALFTTFPITPSTEIPQYFSTFVSNGTVDTEFVAVESEHSAMSVASSGQTGKQRPHCLHLSETKMGLLERQSPVLNSFAFPDV